MMPVDQCAGLHTEAVVAKAGGVRPLRRERASRAFVKLLLISVSLSVFVWIMWSSRAGSLDDYGVFYCAGRVILKGARHQLYDRRAYALEYAAIGKSHPGAFIYPPFEALIFAPLASLPYGISFVVWGALNLLALAAVARLLRPYTQGFKTEDRLAVIAMVFFPVRCALLLGQVSILLLLLLTWALVSLRDKRDFKGGALLALGLFRVQFIVPFALMLAVKRKWKALASFAAAGLILAVTSALLVGWAGCAAFLNLAAHPGGRLEQYVELNRMPNLRGLAIFLFGDAHLTLLISVGSAAILIWCAKAWSGSSSIEQSASLAILASTLTAYYSWLYDLDLLLLPSILGNTRGWKLVALGLAFFGVELLMLALHSRYLPFSLLVPLIFAWTVAVTDRGGTQ